MSIPEIKISYVEPYNPKPVFVNSPLDASEILKDSCFPDEEISFRERFVMLALTRSNKVLGHYLVGIGGLAQVAVDVRNILQAALKSNANSIILSHNHPSGNIKPSESDISLTKLLKEAVKYHNIELHDHIIVTKESYYSFKENDII